MSTEALTYAIERLQTGNVDDLACLHLAVYRKNVSAGFFHNKYNTAYMGVKHIGFIAYNHNHTPIAFYGVIPCFIQHGDKTLLSAQSADTMTHPDYRGKGLFVKLATMTFDLCKETGIRMVFGFPNQNSLPGFIDKLGWQESECMDCFVIPANIINWERLFKKTSLTAKLYDIYTNYILKKYSVNQPGLNNSVLHDGHDGVYRNDTYLSYKNYSPTLVIQTNRALLWVKINNGLIIGDICLATENFNAVMRSVTRLARKLGIKQVFFHASPGTNLHRLFYERYWSVPSFPVIFKELGARIKLNRIKFTTADIDTF
jgi:GNAT superfamily N-acetyltransferase